MTLKYPQDVIAVTERATQIFLEEGLLAAHAYSDSIEDVDLKLTATTAAGACQRGFFAAQKAQEARVRKSLGEVA